MRDNPARFLRNALYIDALTCTLSGLATLAFAHALSEPLGISTALLRGVGASLLPIAAFMAYAASNVPGLRWPAWTVVVGNGVWVLASVLLVISGSEPLTTAGTA